MGKRGPASKTIWSRKNDYGVGLYISANHIYNISGWSSRNAQFFNLFSENPGIFETSQIPPANGNITLGNTLIADFPLMHFDISPNATNTTILPSEDFYLGVIDNQRIEQGPLPQYPTLVQTAASLQMYDADNRTKAIQTWATPVAGEKAIAVGYPQDNGNYPNGAVAYGKILSDTEAADIIQKLKAAGDAEGEVPYNPDVEFFVEAQGIAGMSGGGAFNSEGQLLGIMVRASDKEKAPKIIRVVKVVYIKSRMVEFYNGLPETSKSKVKPFISGEL
ncbi:trypsin-like peptidase domain-containing protein [Chitinophaga sp. CC14]|uniref:trypsin-like peptidase domain-containing protein n=1 Tax=Chitinophaga sp. CC14 TaxID=3029199 RepID=UPI003B78148E